MTQAASTRGNDMATNLQYMHHGCGPVLGLRFNVGKKKPQMRETRPALQENSKADLVTRLKQRSGAIRVSELARILTMSRTTVYQMVEAGKIPHYRIGDSIRFDPVRIASWLTDQEIVG